MYWSYGSIACVSAWKKSMYQMPSRASRTGAFLSRGAVQKCLSCNRKKNNEWSFFCLFVFPLHVGLFEQLFYICRTSSESLCLILVYVPSSELLTEASQSCRSLMTNAKTKHCLISSRKSKSYIFAETSAAEFFSCASIHPSTAVQLNNWCRYWTHFFNYLCTQLCY